MTGAETDKDSTESIWFYIHLLIALTFIKLVKCHDMGSMKPKESSNSLVKNSIFS